MLLLVTMCVFVRLQDLANESAGNPLPPQQLAQALAVAQALADVVGASGGGATAGKQAVAGAPASNSKQQDVVLVPDSEGVLRPTAELAYDDAPWLDAPSAAGMPCIQIDLGLRHDMMLQLGSGDASQQVACTSMPMSACLIRHISYSSD